MVKVMCFGSFDILHDGHRFVFSECKKFGDELVVVVSCDHNYFKLRNYKPKNNELIRLENVSKEPLVDRVLLGYQDDHYKHILDEKPDVIVLGYDQKSFIDDLNEKLISFNLDTKVVRLKSFHPDKFKSSLLKK